MTCPWLAECLEAFREAQARVRRLYADLSPEQLAWKPAQDRWSVLQCVQHLVLVRQSHRPVLRAAGEAGRDKGITGGAPPYGAGTELGQMLLAMFSSTEKQQTFPDFQPSDRLDPGQVLDSFNSETEALIDVVEDADGLDLGSIEVQAPKAEIGTLSLAQGFRLHVVHDDRHLAQAEALREEAGFPTA